MENILALVILLAVLAGELLRVPFLSSGNIIVLDLAVFVLVIYGFLKSKLNFRSIPSFFKLGVIFTLIGFLALIITPLKLSLNQFLISLSYDFRFLLYLLFGGLIAKGFIFSDKKISLLVYAGLGLAILGFLQFIFFPNLGFLTEYGWDPHKYRLVSTLLDPNFTGSFLAASLLTIYLLREDFSLKKAKIFFIIIFIALDLTFSRSAYLMFGSEFLILALLKRSIRIIAQTAVLSLVLLLSLFGYQKVVALPQGINRTASAQARLSTWQQGSQMFIKSPITGVGFNAYRFALNQYNLAPPDQIDSHGGASNDSSLLTVLSTTGILGSAVFIIFLISLLNLGWKNYQKGRQEGIILISLLIGFIAQSFFVNILFYPFILLIIFLVVGKNAYLAKTSS